jgi:hypothetical protein
MPRFCAAPLTVLAALAVAAPAAARSFTLTTHGNKPSVAVDAAGTAHVAWDEVDNDNTSTTHYCRVARNGARCLPGTERTFSPVPGDQDFGGPRVYLPSKGAVLVVTSRCCTSADAPDGAVYGTRTFAIGSADGGATFGEPAWIGTQVPDVGATFSRGAFLAFGITADGDGTALQSASLAGFTGAARTVTRKRADSGGVGTSPKGNVVAFADTRNNVVAGALKGDPNFATIRFTKLGKGSDVVVTGGPSGVDLFYKTNGRDQRYIVRRYKGTKAGKIAAVSELGFPIFGNAFQDALGRVHAVWQGDRGLTYRRSAKSGTNFGKPRRLSAKTKYFNLIVAANPKGQATVVYDSNGFAGRVGGFTAG